VHFENGAIVVTPQLGAVHPLDYEVCDPRIGGPACDEAIVPGCPSGVSGASCIAPTALPAAAQLSQNAGTYPAKLSGETVSLKLDRVLTPHQNISLRLSAARSYGSNNVSFDSGSPITNNAMSGNGQEDVSTESALLSLTSSITPRLTSHLRAQFSRDLERSLPNTTGTRTHIYGWMKNLGQSSTLPRGTREHRLHLAETMSLNRGRNQWKFGADTLRTWDYDYFPSMYGGGYYFSNIYVNPLTFVPEPSNTNNLKLTPLRAYAHTIMPGWDWDSASWTGPSADLPRYYMQNFGNPVSHPDSNDYAAFVQDTARLTPHLSLSMGVRYDLQTFSKQGLVINPLWAPSGKMPLRGKNFAPRVGIGYAWGNNHPVMVRAGFGIFYIRLPGMYHSAVINNNGLNNSYLFLDNSVAAEHQVLLEHSYPNAVVDCPRGPVTCPLPTSLLDQLPQQIAPGAITTEVSAFAPSFKTPRVLQSSLSLERELPGWFSGTVSYLYVHGVDMIRARDVNLPPPTYYSYPVYDSTGYIFQNTFYNVESFSTWESRYSINPLVRPVPQLGAIDQLESAASSVYHGMTISVRKRMAGGMDFRLAYTWAHAIDDGQDAPATGASAVQNSASTKSEKASSVTDQRQRLSIAMIEETNPFAARQKALAVVFDHWKVAGIMTYGSGRPASAMVSGDPNQDGNTSNDRLSKYGRNSFIGPDYASMDLRLTRKLDLGGRYHLELTAESFNLFNRDNKRDDLSNSGYFNAAGQFVRYTQNAGGTYYPAYYQQPTSLMKPMNAFTPRQMQFSMRLNF
jgi:hypothetical protein